MMEKVLIVLVLTYFSAAVAVPFPDESLKSVHYTDFNAQQVDVKINPNDDDTRIMGGSRSTHTYPFLVSIKTGASICGGTLINSKWVVTAAHCIAKNAKITVFFNSTSLFKGHSEDVIQIIKHPQYKYGFNVENDIALLKLQNQIPGNIGIAAELPKDEDENTSYGGVTAMILGWGRTELGVVTSMLREAEINLVDNKDCKKTTLTNKQICANTGEMADKPVTTCVGDSGGPLVVKTPKGSYKLIGIVSYTAPDLKGECHTYAVYTKVAAYKQWIEDNIKQNS